MSNETVEIRKFTLSQKPMVAISLRGKIDVYENLMLSKPTDPTLKAMVSACSLFRTPEAVYIRDSNHRGDVYRAIFLENAQYIDVPVWTERDTAKKFKVNYCLPTGEDITVGSYETLPPQ